MRSILLLLCVLLSPHTGLSELRIPEKGVPDISTVPAELFQRSGKVWSIHTAPNGIAYMASDKGLVEYDGNKWEVFKGSTGITRSVLVLSDSVLFTGSDRDFGVWRRDRNGDFLYSSLYPFREELPQINEEFWHTCTLNGYVVFVSAGNIYLYKDQTITKIPAPDRITGAFSDGDSLYIAAGSSLLMLNGPDLKTAGRMPAKETLELKGVFTSGESTFVVTKDAGLFHLISGALLPVQSQLSQELKNAGVFSFRVIGDTYLSFGTVSKGVLVTDLEGNTIHRINKSNGLPNNTILSMHFDAAGNLWLGMDYGVSKLDLSSPLTYFFDYSGSFGTGYTAALLNGRFYLGTNQGLYTSGWEQLHNRSGQPVLRLIPGSAGQVWNLTVIDETLWVGHDRGLFTLENETLRRQAQVNGVWNLIPFRDRLLAGTYNGIAVLEKKNGRFVHTGQLEEVLGSCNQLFAEGDSVLWIHIPTYGIMRTAINEAFKPERRKLFAPGLFSGDDPVLSVRAGRVSVATTESSYRWNALTAAFQPDGTMAQPASPPARLPGVFQPLPLNSTFSFQPVFNGFALRDASLVHDSSRAVPVPLIRNVYAYHNSGRMRIQNGDKVPFAFNNIHVTVAVPNRGGLRFQFRRNGSGTWTEPATAGTSDWVGLNSGLNEFLVRTVSQDGRYSEAVRFRFRVAPPWYRTWYSTAGFVVLSYIVAFFLFRRFRSVLTRKEQDFKRQQQQSLHEQEERHRQLLLEIEQKNLQDAFDQVKNQLRHKTMELARKAHENEIKNQLLDTIKEKFEQLKQHPESLKSRATEIQRLLDTYISQKDQTFEIQLNELHQDFFEKLKKHTPGLSPHDLKLCAYIKIGFNSKEIADLLSIQPSSVYITRSRLRKKLNLDTDDDLHGFLNNL
jgi:DNA-binding CsgD family transcriptional regulator